MSILKLCKAIGGTVVLSIALMHAPAQAAVDFNSDPTTSPSLASIVSGDYTFSSTSYSAIVNGLALPYGASNGTNMLVFSNNGVLTVTRTDSNLFALSSLDVGGWLGLPQNTTAQLSITGHTQSGDRTIFSALSSTSFAQVTTSALFTNLTSLTLKTTGYTGGAYFAAIDNLALAPVPDPETYAMMLAGLGLLGFLGRRRKQ